jgi:hypothetical protein
MHFYFFKKAAVLSISEETDNQHRKVKCKVEDVFSLRLEAFSRPPPTTCGLEDGKRRRQGL